MEQTFQLREGFGFWKTDPKKWKTEGIEKIGCVLIKNMATYEAENSTLIRGVAPILLPEVLDAVGRIPSLFVLETKQDKKKHI